MSFDPSAVLLNVVTVAFTFWLAWIAVKLGKKTGNVCFWRRITYGWILVGIGRIFMAIVEAGIGTNINAVYDLRDFGLTIILIAVLLMLWGMYGFLHEMEAKPDVVGSKR